MIMADLRDPNPQVTTGNTYLLTGGWYKGEGLVVDFIDRKMGYPTCSGTTTVTHTVINSPLCFLAPFTDPGKTNANLVRQTAAKFLKQGNKAAALKLLKTLKP